MKISNIPLAPLQDSINTTLSSLAAHQGQNESYCRRVAGIAPSEPFSRVVAQSTDSDDSGLAITMKRMKKIDRRLVKLKQMKAVLSRLVTMEAVMVELSDDDLEAVYGSHDV